MSFIAAGVVLLLALAVGIVSLAAVPKIEQRDCADAAPKSGSDATPAAAVPTIFKTLSWQQWALWFGGVLLCAVAAYRLHATGMSAIDLCRHSAVALFLLAAMLIDGKTHRIPNLLVLALLGVGAALIGTELIIYHKAALRSLIMSAAGLLICLVLFYVLSRLTRDGISMGDVKLIAAMGWVLGVSTTLFAVLAAMLICSVTAIFLLLCKKKNKNDRVAFGPFLFFGYILTLILFSL